MDFRLKVFQTVAKFGSYTRAAKELKISQPAVTKHIQELEQQYQNKFFERIGTSIRITAAGERLLSHANRILDAYNWLHYDIHQLNNEIAGELRIGAGATVSQYILPAILAQFVKKHPGIKFKIVEGYSEEIEQSLLNHQIDIGITEKHLLDNNFVVTPFFKEKVVAICAPNCAIAANNHLSTNELRKIPLVMREVGSGSIDLLEATISKSKLRLSDFNIMVNMANAESIKRFVEHCDCIGFVSENAVINELASGKLKQIEIDDLNLTRNFQFIRRTSDKNELLDEFIRFSKKKFYR